MKKCTGCNAEKAFDEFYKSKTQDVNGLTFRCKLCMRHASRLSWKKKSEEKKAEELKRGRYINGTIVPSVYPKIMDQPETIRKVVMAWMENPTATQKEIGVLTGLTPDQMNYACLYNPYLKAFRSLAQKTVKTLIPLAVYGLKQCLTSHDDNIKLKAALELLKSEKVLGADRVDVTVDDARSRPIEEVRKLIQEAKLIPQPTISDENLIGNRND